MPALEDVIDEALDRATIADPDQFSVADITDSPLGVTHVADPFEITGIKFPVIIRATGENDFAVNGGSFVTEAVVQAGDMITRRMAASFNNSTAVQGTLTAAATTHVWTITTGAFWSPFLDNEMVAFAFMQEDLDEGEITTWTSRGIKPKTATGNCTRLSSNQGVEFVGLETMKWAVDTDANILNRWWCVIARADLANGSSNVTPVLTVHTGQNANVYKQPRVAFAAPVTGTFVSTIQDSTGSKALSGTANQTYATWNVAIGMQRGWQYRARINSAEPAPLEFLAMAPNNQSSESWLGAGFNFPGNTASGTKMAIDCVLVGQGEPNDGFIQKLEGWAYWRAGREDLLPVGHPYKAAPPAPDGSEGVPSRYTHSAEDWAAYVATAQTTTNFGLQAPDADVDYKRIFFDDFLVDSVKDRLSMAPTEVWGARTHLANIGKDATALDKDGTPSCYIHTAAEPGIMSLRLQETATPGVFVTGAMASVNEVGKGRCWGGECIFKARIRFTGIPAFAADTWPGFFPAWWFYGKSQLYWLTRRRFEYDIFEHEGGNVEDDRIASALHVHESNIINSPVGDKEPGYSSAGIINSNHLNTTTAVGAGMPRNWPTDFHAYDGEFHDYEWRVEQTQVLVSIDGIEVGRKTHDIADMLLAEKYMLFDFALFTNVGVSAVGLGPWDMDIDSVEVWKKETALAVVPDEFSGRPTLAGTRGNGNTITLTTNVVEANDQLEIRWYKGGEPIVGQAATTFVEDADSATKALRVHIRNLSHYDCEAWTAELAV